MTDILFVIKANTLDALGFKRVFKYAQEGYAQSELTFVDTFSNFILCSAPEPARFLRDYYDNAYSLNELVVVDLTDDRTINRVGHQALRR